MIPWLQRLAGKLSVNVNLRWAGKRPWLAEVAYRTLHYLVFPLFRLTGKLFGDPNLYIHSYGAWFYEQNPKRAMVPHKPLTFEGHVFEGPADPDELCRIAYGNYMGTRRPRRALPHRLWQLHGLAAQGQTRPPQGGRGIHRLTPFYPT